jgi:hypothetical protein
LPEDQAELAPANSSQVYMHLTFALDICNLHTHFTFFAAHFAGSKLATSVNMMPTSISFISMRSTVFLVITHLQTLNSWHPRQLNLLTGMHRSFH